MAFMKKKVVGQMGESEARIKKQIGGYIYVEPSREMPLQSLVAQCFSTLVDPDKIGQSVQVCMAALKENKEARVDVAMSGLFGELSFFKKDGHLIIGVEVKKAGFSEPPTNYAISNFRQNWIKLCESLKSRFGYFGDYPELLTPEKRDAMLLNVTSYSVNDMEDFGGWLMYFASEFSKFTILQAKDLNSGGRILGDNVNPITKETLN